MDEAAIRRIAAPALRRAAGALDRRSRFLTLAFSCLAFGLSVCPRLVVSILLLAPQKFGPRSIRLGIANALFQLDHPAEALQYLDRSSRSDRWSTEETLLRAMCLFQGLGRFRDAVSVLTRANEMNAQEAEKLGLGNLSFRVLDRVWAWHIGHTATLDYVIKLGILEGRSREQTILYVPAGAPVANRFLLQQIAPHLSLIDRAGDLPFDASAVPALHFDYLGPRRSDQTTAYFWELAGQTHQRWRQQGRRHLLAFPSETEARGWDVLHAAGVPKGAWFVALHVREGKWDKTKAGAHGVVNAEIGTYLSAIAAITRRGGWVVRMGDPGMRPMPPLPNVFDYCHSDARADWMDIFIAARCRFMLGTSSGPAYIPALYGVPSVLTNWWPTAQRPWQASDLFIPKMMRRLDGSYLTLNETLREPFSYCHSRRFLASLGVHVEDSEPEIICGAVEEMLTRLEGHLPPDSTSEALRQRSDLIYRSNDAFGEAALARDFLCRYDGFVA